jgi:hypothetical protein
MAAELTIDGNTGFTTRYIDVTNTGDHRAVSIELGAIAAGFAEARMFFTAAPTSLEAGASFRVDFSDATDRPALAVVTLRWKSLDGTRGETSRSVLLRPR